MNPTALFRDFVLALIPSTVLAICTLGVAAANAEAQSVARRWNEVLLDAIRMDFPAPTVHARNLYHTSAAMYDAWATYDPIAGGHFAEEKNSVAGKNVTELRREAISYAAYRVLSQRYALAVDPAGSQQLFDDLMNDLGFDRNITTTEGDSPAAIGNRIAQSILSSAMNDGANEANGYIDNTGYSPFNLPMVVEYPGILTPDAPSFGDPNRWQPLSLSEARTQNELVAEDIQTFIGPHWGDVTPFAMGRRDNGVSPSWASLDPGGPPLLNGVGDSEYRSDTVLLVEYSNALDPHKGPGSESINISPSVAGNRPLGTHNDLGYSENPVTGTPYPDNIVKTADYGRVLAEFWADGPKSETPPGHWNVIANEVSESPAVRGTTPELEWDVKLYLALNGATHDAAVAAWGTKREYDYVRPITKIRYQGSLGQSTDVSLPSYHPDGLPLQDGLIELITSESIAEGGRHRNVFVNANRDSAGNFVDNLTEADLAGRIAVHSWNHEPDDPETEVSGTDWILAENWVPYQEDNFVTPAFAAYVSGHSTFSRAAAEVLTLFTGSEYFPGGLGEKTFDQEFLDFEDGPSAPITLQWATYYDAADEAGISRLWGGIHVPADDFAGRIMGSKIGIDAFHYADDIFVRDDLGWCNVVFTPDVDNDGTVSPTDVERLVDALNTGAFTNEFGQAHPLVGIPPAFLDVTNDGYIVPQDALAVLLDLSAVQSNSGITAAVPEPTRLFLWFILIGVRLRKKRWSSTSS